MWCAFRLGFITFGYNLSVQTPFYWWAFGVVIGLGGSIAVERFGLKDALMKKATKKSDHVRDSKTDIRDLMAKRKQSFLAMTLKSISKMMIGS